jgi:hypothetical protein
MDALRSEFNRRSVPRIVSRLGTRERLGSLAPALACVAPGAAPPSIQQSLTLCIEVKKSQDLLPLRRVHRVIAADEFVVGHAAVCQDNSPPRLDPYLSAERKARSKDQRVEQIAFKSQVARHGAVVKRARQGRDEVHVAGGPAFEKAASRHLDYYIYLWHQGRCLAAKGSAVIRVVHCASLP